MCTLIVARDVVAPGTVLLAANRDENPGRPTDPPMILGEMPRIAGGRDRVAGGTWLAVREGPSAVALLNRRDMAGVVPTRSRGLLTLEVAAAAEPSARERVLALLEAERYAPFTLLVASPRACWIFVHDGEEDRVTEVTAGWHVLTHRELDDRDEPRASYLLERLRHLRPRDRAEAERHAMDLLREHGERGTPAVCLHEGPMVTVSSSIVWLGQEAPRYLHAEGRPCEHAYVDQTRLLEPALEGGRS